MSKRILIITPGFLPLLGGMEEQVYTLSEEFLRLGHSVDVLTEKSEDSFLDNEIIDGILVHRIEKPLRGSPLFIFYLYLKIGEYLKGMGGFDLIIVRTFTSYGLVIGFMKFVKRIKSPIFITADTGGEFDELTPIMNSRFRFLYKLIFGQYDYINSICELNYKKYLQLGFSSEKLTKIYNGINCLSYRRYNYPKKVVNFLFIAQLKAEKGLYETIEAFECLIQRHPQSKLFIAGDGKEYENLKLVISKRGLKDSIHLLGRVKRGDRDDFYKRGDCLVLPSYSEGFGLVYYEAALHKKLIISTDVADIKKVFADQAIYCNKRDAKDLYEKMLFAIEGYNLNNLNYDRILDLVSIEKTASSILKLIK